ncbi:MAG: extracellular solute-binding protein [Kiritimatiellia bacterium]
MKNARLPTSLPGQAPDLRFRRKPLPGLILTVLVPVAAILLAWLWLQQGRRGLVVACTHDAEFAALVFDAFTKKTGIPVTPVYDTEATKSLALVEQIQRENGRPRADVLWNNEMLGMLELQRRGLLAPHAGEGWKRMPAAWRDPDGLWTAFGARMRGMIVNTTLVSAAEAARDPLPAGDLSKFTMAKPQFGTTLTHAAALWQELGADAFKAWWADAQARGLKVVAGNGMTKSLVADGACRAGFTDTDDYASAREAGKPVAFVPARLPSGKTIAIPNTVALLRGAKHESDAKVFIDFLLSADSEVLLANSAARQIPLGPVDAAKLPPEVSSWAEAARNSVDLRGLLDARNACLEWIRSAGAGK